jgi:hypothetical protein
MPATSLFDVTAGAEPLTHEPSFQISTEVKHGLPSCDANIQDSRRGSLLIGDRTPDEIFIPEDFTNQHLLIAQTVEEFASKEIVPNTERMEHEDVRPIGNGRELEAS